MTKFWQAKAFSAVRQPSHSIPYALPRAIAPQSPYSEFHNMITRNTLKNKAYTCLFTKQSSTLITTRYRVVFPPLGRSVAHSLPRSLGRVVARSLGRSAAWSLDRSTARPLGCSVAWSNMSPNHHSPKSLKALTCRKVTLHKKHLVILAPVGYVLPPGDVLLEGYTASKVYVTRKRVRWI